MSLFSISRLAVLIDGDNISLNDSGAVVDIANSLCLNNSFHAFGAPGSTPSRWWGQALEEAGARDVQAVRHMAGKNAADQRLTIAAMDLLYQDAADGYLLVTHDGHLVPIAERLKRAGKHVFGCARSHVSRQFKNVCDHFFDLSMPIDVDGNHSSRLDRRQLKMDIGEAIAATADADGWSELPRLGEYLKQHSASYSTNRCGYRSLSTLLLAMDFKVSSPKGLCRRTRQHRLAVATSNRPTQLDSTPATTKDQSAGEVQSKSPTPAERHNVERQNEQRQNVAATEQPSIEPSARTDQEPASVSPATVQRQQFLFEYEVIQTTAASIRAARDLIDREIG